ncbi:hypothetical protein EVAR_26393_1 [Eumeta japonica]|uniref:Uncharacterized protein n=1 Tax=Eumeta variegata TaxID=151549 RepID=A0A4C1VQB4_EUMVA|nr:hypothetical protein EVAR_26393_1 [Eumeta japonica]
MAPLTRRDRDLSPPPACCARGGRPIIVEWERDARHSAGLSLVRFVQIGIRNGIKIANEEKNREPKPGRFEIENGSKTEIECGHKIRIEFEIEVGIRRELKVGPPSQLRVRHREQSQMTNIREDQGHD